MQMQGTVIQKNGRYTVRIITQTGYLSGTQLIALSEIAMRYSKADLFFTSRGTIEISDVEEEKVQDLIACLGKANISVGGTGTTVRAVTQCKGATCRSSLSDPGRLSKILDEKFFGEAVPKKFKISVFGCRNSTGKAMCNDVGIVAANMQRQYYVYLGGMAGHNVRQGQKLDKLVPENEIVPLVRRCLDFYKQHGQEKERFGQMLERLDIDINKTFFN